MRAKPPSEKPFGSARLPEAHFGLGMACSSRAGRLKQRPRSPRQRA